MPYVQIAWYSVDDPSRYHVCRNCSDNAYIGLGDLVVDTETRVQAALATVDAGRERNDMLCSNCASMVMSGVGRVFVILVDEPRK